MSTPKPSLRWAYGITTVPKRRLNELQTTVASLAKSGFDKPHLFVDGAMNDEFKLYWEQFPDLLFTFHNPKLSGYGNWIMALWELYIRYPSFDRYVIFQDDIIVAQNLRAYLERQPYLAKRYYNLITYPTNEKFTSNDRKGWFSSDQQGRGAQALMFDRTTVQTILINQRIIYKPAEAQMAHKRIDGTLCVALKKAQYVELIHNPSLVSHTGIISTLNNGKQPEITSFPGENYDLLQLLP